MSRHSSAGPDWERIRARILERDNYLCQYCQQQQATTVDHITPKVHGGTDDDANLLAACRDCNGKKGSRTLTRLEYRNDRWYPRPS